MSEAKVYEVGTLAAIAWGLATGAAFGTFSSLTWWILDKAFG